MNAAELLPLDPFASVADPARYVPRAATEQARAALRSAVVAGPGRPIAFTGPAGIGKSMLLRVLAADLAPDYTFLCLQASPRDAEEICESALHALGDTVSRDATGMLALRAAELARRGRPLVLALDSAEGLDRECLAELAARLDGTLRLLLVASERDGLDEDLAALGPTLQRVRLSAPLSRPEAEDYLRARLDAADAPPELRVRLLGMALDLWRRSKGNPQALHAEISQVQLELWRSAAAESPLRLVPAPAALDDACEIEVDAELAPVPELTPALLVEAAAVSEPLPGPAPAAPGAAGAGRERARGAAPFALGALTGALLASAAWLWIGRGPALTTAAAPASAPAVAAPVPARAEPVLPAVSAAPEPPAEAPPPPLPPVPAQVEPIAPPPAEAPLSRAPVAPPAPVRVSVQALPWATIYVDGQRVGETPLGDLQVSPGLREFRAEMPDGRKLTKRVDVRAGARVLFQ